MLKCRVDGLQVLKGGQGKATIYFSKEAMHGALDLNEQDVVIGLAEVEQVKESPYDVYKHSIMGMVDNLIDTIRAECKPKLLKEGEDG